MKLLLDESLPRRLKADLKGHDVKTVPEVGLRGKKNGELLKLIEGKFDIFITVDQNLQYQINLRNTTIPIMVLGAQTNRYAELKKLVGKILKQLELPQDHRIIRISE